MSIIYTIKNSLRLMLANKTRTILTILGIMIGITSIIIVYSAGEGIKSLLLEQVKSFGTDIIETEIKIPSNKKGAGGEQSSAINLASGVQITSLTLKDMADVAKLPNIKNAYAGVMDQELISYRNESRKAFIMGTNASYIDIDSSEIESGRWFTKAENKAVANVAVIGQKIVEKVFNNQNPIGKFIKIRQQKFLVIGVMKPRGAVMFFDFDEYVYIPIKTLQKKIMGIKHISYMVHQLKDISLAEDTAEQARWIIRHNHGISNPDKDDFRTVTMNESMEKLNTIIGAITLLLLAIVAVSLIVGGVGIMNIMYVIVAERTAEIGLKKAVGATEQNILIEFLIESTLITILGGTIGLIIGIIISYLIALLAQHAGLSWQFSVPLQAFVVAFLFSLVFGIIFGIYPAKKAAQLDPIQALQKE